jgi:hypothetical protein
MEKQSRNLGLSMVVAGLGVIVFAVLVGITKEGGGPDWVSIITAIAGFVMAATGLIALYGAKGTGAGSGEPTPHGTT